MCWLAGEAPQEVWRAERPRATAPGPEQGHLLPHRGAPGTPRPTRPTRPVGPTGPPGHGGEPVCEAEPAVQRGPSLGPQLALLQADHPRTTHHPQRSEYYALPSATARDTRRGTELLVEAAYLLQHLSVRLFSCRCPQALNMKVRNLSQQIVSTCQARKDETSRTTSQNTLTQDSSDYDR